jgi:hypothetical protein
MDLSLNDAVAQMKENGRACSAKTRSHRTAGIIFRQVGLVVIAAITGFALACALLLGLSYTVISPVNSPRLAEVAYRPTGRTVAYLHDLGELITLLHDAAEDDMMSYHSLSEIVQSCVELGWIAADKKDRFEKDSWRRPFKYKCSKGDRCMIVQVSSDGPDGVSQGGDGDDIVLTVILPTNGEYPRLHLRWVAYGRVKTRTETVN